MSTTFRTIVEQEPFVEAIRQLGGEERVDKALTALVGALSYRPEGFPLVGRIGWRLAKTDPYFDIDREEHIPALRLYFQIADRGEVVLWWIEEIPDDEIPF